MRVLAAFLLLASSLPFSQCAAKDDPLRPCTAKSPSGLFYDLNPMAVTLPADGVLKPGARNTSWTARGYDYHSNFTINFCAPVVEKLEDVEGVDHSLRKNVSAFYVKNHRTYSLGQLSTAPVFRGRKLVLNYTHGSPCDTRDEKRDAERHRPNSYGVDPYGGDRELAPASVASSHRRKSAVISLLCDRDAADPSKPRVGVSLVGWSEDECAYFFEARSPSACGGAVSESQTVGPGGVFSVIILIALAVYILGGVAYQRTVMNQRGWRQLPHYSMWAGIASFFWDLALHALSCCTRAVPRRRGYNQLPPTGRRNEDAENRLIDNYDEEWED